eukprot:TRINITY_DN2812_c0_g1_i4.p1 TRINITY_DN2812_c0_g1~~TRINITY_DN2812_c0_g1_i4.p1  ORF type:complete len:287 (-),score=38.61 TRINITY_DN2812_c0_g1_i4:53-913(-)
MVKSVSMWMQKEHPNIDIFVEKDVQNDLSSQNLPFKSISTFDPQILPDFVISLGGDGTLLHISRLFSKKVPPILTFHMGSLGFLNSYDNPDSYPLAINRVLEGNFTMSRRMRLEATIFRNNYPHKNPIKKVFPYLNELVLTRCDSQVLGIQCSVNGKLLTTTYGDGLILATPTGSTAYSMSCGGSMVHPSVDSLLITPIAPTSLSFRPLILPSTSKITLRVDSNNDDATISWDGQSLSRKLTGKDWIEVRKSRHPIHTIDNQDATYDWTKNIKDLLYWNKGLSGRK